MAEDNLNPKNSQPQNNVPDNLPGIEVTDPDETTQRISTEAPTQKPAPAPEPEIKPAPTPLEQPEPPKQPEPLPQPVPKPEPKPTPEPQPIPQQVGATGEVSKLKPLRTYKEDLANVMGTRKGSLVGMAAAESERRYSKDGSKPESSPSKASKKDFRKRVGVIILSTLLIVLGIGSVFYFYGKSNIDTTTLGSKIPTIIFADNDLEFNVTDLSRRQTINELTAIRNRTKLSLGRIENIFLTESFVDEEGLEKRTLISANNFLNLIDVQIPTSFLRSLARDFMIGVHVFDGNQPFIILKTNFYENAFVGMLEWERYIKQDLSPFFDQVESTVVPVKTATTTV